MSTRRLPFGLGTSTEPSVNLPLRLRRYANHSLERRDKLLHGSAFAAEVAGSDRDAVWGP